MPPKRKRSAKEIAADKSRAATVRQRWKEARRYADRHGTTPRLDRRTVALEVTNENIREETRKLFASKRRTRTGRATESKKIPRAAEFRLTLVKPDGEFVQSDTLAIGQGASNESIQRAMRDAVFGVLRADTEYDEIENVEIDPDGDLVIDDEEWEILIERDFVDESLLEEFAQPGEGRLGE